MKTLLIDANNMLYRAYFVNDLRDKKGRRTSGVYNSIIMLTKLIDLFTPDRLVIAWDGGKSIERSKIYPDYKAQRSKYRNEEDTANLEFSRVKLKEIFDQLPIYQIQVEGVEADDIIGYLNMKMKGARTIVSNDQDFFQLVGEKTSVFMPIKSRVITSLNIEKELGFPVEHYILYKSMVGDPSDNIKGISGIGPKKAAAIIQTVIQGNKLPISPEDMEIIERNKYLMIIGKLLTDEQKKEIVSSYKTCIKIKKNIELIRLIFTQLNFRYLSLSFPQFKNTFRGLDLIWQQKK
jgi:DNA polymerase-1